MERLVAERKLFHRACFRCDKCGACLRPGTYHYFPEKEKFCCLFDCTGGNNYSITKHDKVLCSAVFFFTILPLTVHKTQL